LERNLAERAGMAPLFLGKQLGRRKDLSLNFSIAFAGRTVNLFDSIF
jgi:hypothetical protein